jgi:hypothetical protein
MPRLSRYPIQLTSDERSKLEMIARKYTLPHYEVVRAKMVLLAARGLPNDRIGAALSAPRADSLAHLRRACSPSTLLGAHSLAHLRRAQPAGRWPRLAAVRTVLWQGSAGVFSKSLPIEMVFGNVLPSVSGTRQVLYPGNSTRS